MQIVGWVIAGIMVIGVGGFCGSALVLSIWDDLKRRHSQKLIEKKMKARRGRQENRARSGRRAPGVSCGPRPHLLEGGGKTRPEASGPEA